MEVKESDSQITKGTIVWRNQTRAQNAGSGDNCKYTNQIAVFLKSPIMHIAYLFVT